MTDGRHFRDEETVRMWPPADPWAVHDGATAQWPTVDPEPAPRRTSRRVYGRVYELFTDRPQDGPHPYVGQTIQTLAQRKRGHRSKRDIAADPWKAHIIDGPRGHRLLETVYATGDERADQRELDRAEAFWIDRLRPTHNDVRPVRPRAGDPLPVRPREKARPVRRAAPAKRRRTPWRVYLCLVLFALATAGCAVVLDRGGASDAMICAVSPAFGAGAAWAMTMDLLRRARRLGIR